MSQQQPSGIDLARAALAAQRASAKSRPVQQKRKTRTPRHASSRRAGDPMGLGAAIDRMMADRGWEPPEEGGSVLDQWPSIAPELAAKVTAVRFEHDTGTLHLRPVSPAYATQLRLHQAQVLARVQQALGGRSVRALKILPVGGAPAAVAVEVLETTTRPAEAGPVRTRETASPGYRQTLAAALGHRPEPRHADPYLEQAMRRQEAALRANRAPDVEEPEQLTERQVDRSEAVRRAALARKRQDQACVIQPRRVFDVA